VQPLLNKIVWVTGAGSGIGEAAALTLAKAGGAVVLTGRRREPLETVAHRIRAEGGTAHVEPGDLMDPDAVKRIGAAINDKIGRLDILVNNAGVNINDRHWDKLTPENAKLMIDGNLFGAGKAVLRPVGEWRQILWTSSASVPQEPRPTKAYRSRRERRHSRAVA